MTDIFRKIKNKPKLFDIDANGDFLIKNKDGDVTTTIPVGPYRVPTKEDIIKTEEARWGRIRTAEEKYEEVLEALRDVGDKFKLGQISMSALMRANMDMEKADRARNNAQYAIRQTVEREGYEVRSVLFEDKYETRKMAYPLYIGRTRPHTLQQQYVRHGYDVEEEVEVAAEVAAEAGPEVEMAVVEADTAAIVFGGPDDNEYGYLASDFPVEFTLNGVRYFTVDQALAAEKARIYRDEDIRQKVMKSRSTKMMRVYAEMLDKKGVPKNVSGEDVAIAALEAQQIRPEVEEWAKLRLGILDAATYAKFKQNVVLDDKLLKTGDRAFVYADVKNRVDGIGLALGDEKVGDSTKWKGANGLGKVLERVRAKLRGSTDEEQQEGAEEVKEATITQEEYDEKLAQSAKLGAILASRRARSGR